VRRALAALAAVLCVSCAPGLAPLAKLPSGGGVPVGGAEAVAPFTQATTRCIAVDTMTAEVAVSGSVGGSRVRTRLSAGITRPAARGVAPAPAARLEAAAPFGAPFFIFVATGNDATLLLPRDNRILEHGPAAAVLGAVTGVALDTADLDGILTGCPLRIGQAFTRSFGTEWQIISMGADDLYVHRETAASPWRFTAIQRRGAAGVPQWRADFSNFVDALPRTIRLVSLVGSRGAAFDLQLVLSQVDASATVAPEAFTIQISAGATPITLDELRRSGPLAQPAADGR
jgi:hypothetical protein